MPSRYPKWLWWLIVLVLRQVVTLAIWRKTGRLPRRSGTDNVPKSGGLIIVANHVSDFDPIVMQWASPRPVHFMAKEELFAIPRLGKLMRIFQAFPVKPDTADRAAIKRAVALLKLGEVVMIFPEGQLAKPGEVLPLQKGYELIARMASAPVVACRIVGTDQVMPYGKTKLQAAPGAEISMTFSAKEDSPEEFLRRVP